LPQSPPFTTFREVSGHLMRVTETAHWLEWQDRANPILAEPFRLKNSHLLIPVRPGSGIEWDEDAITRYRLDA
jgi:mandelate racemase